VDDHAMVYSGVINANHPPACSFI